MSSPENPRGRAQSRADESADVELSHEDRKLVTLARGARSRVGAPEGAAVRDETGRTYSGATVSLETLSLSALGLAVAQAVAAGGHHIDAVALVTGGELTDDDRKLVKEFGHESTPIVLADSRGTVSAVLYGDARIRGHHH